MDILVLKHVFENTEVCALMLRDFGGSGRILRRIADAITNWMDYKSYEKYRKFPKIDMYTASLRPIGRINKVLNEPSFQL